MNIEGPRPRTISGVSFFQVRRCDCAIEPCALLLPNLLRLISTAAVYTMELVHAPIVLPTILPLAVGTRGLLGVAAGRNPGRRPRDLRLVGFPAFQQGSVSPNRRTDRETSMSSCPSVRQKEATEAVSSSW
jgi:hypothetical protein